MRKALGGKISGALFAALLLGCRPAWAGPYHTSGSDRAIFPLLLLGSVTLLVSQFLVEIWLMVRYRRALSVGHAAGMILLPPLAVLLACSGGFGCLAGLRMAGLGWTFSDGVLGFDVPYLGIFFGTMHFANRYMVKRMAGGNESPQVVWAATLIPFVSLALSLVIALLM